MSGAPDGWDPAIYERFRRQRERPFDDLLGLVERRPRMRVIDLGCGTGALTLRLHRELGAGETLGVDRSPAMLAQAPSGAAPGLAFVRADIAALAAAGRAGLATAGFDLVFSNAALHWLPDHPRLLAELAALLRPGGQLAVQLPAMHEAATFRAAVATAESAPHRDRLGGFVQRYGTLAPAAYARLLHRLGFGRQRVRLEVYLHALPSREAVCDWAAGSTLTPYRQRLPGAAFAGFLADYRARLLAELEEARPYPFPFRRILLWAALPHPPAAGRSA